MSLCFSVGIQGRNPSSRLASGIHIVEHVRYEIRHKETDNIQLFTDFFFPNTSREEQIFSFMHVGDILFKTVCADEILSRRNFQTHFIEKVYGPSLKASLSRSEGLIYNMSPSKISPVDIRNAENYRTTLSRRVGGTEEGTPFTLCDVCVPRYTYGYVRVHGVIEGKMLEKLTDNKKSFDIFGGDILLDRIKTKYISECLESCTKDDMRKRFESYETVLDSFVENEYVEPERYDVVISSSPQTKLTRVSRLSSDLTYGCEGKVLGGKEIYWYWSRSARFHTSSHINGLRVCVELGV